VYLEFNGRTNADCYRLFNVDKHTLGRILFNRIRERSLSEVRLSSCACAVTLVLTSRYVPFAEPVSYAV
jgi:hypothetical protein